LAFKTVRQVMVDRGWCRTTVTKRMGIIKSMFRWGTENELVPTNVFHGLQAVSGLRKGRSGAKEHAAVGPVPEGSIGAVLKHVPPQVQVMIRMQLYTGMRPGEVATMRACDLDTTGRIWQYTPMSHKTEHHGRDRQVWLGPKAQTVVHPFLNRDLAAYLFSPNEAEEERNAQRRVTRRSPMTPSQAKRKRKHNRTRPPRDRYDKDSYRRAIQRACDKAFPPPVPLAQRKGESKKQWQARLTAEQKAELRQWQREHRWSPNQLRHNAATFLRKEFGIDAARVILGHSSPATTEIYAELDQAKAIEIMGKVG